MFLALLIICGSLLSIIAIGALIWIQSDDLLVFVFAAPAVALFIAFLTSLYFRNKHILARRIQRVCEISFTIAGVNFISFLIIHILIGGSAPNGKIDGGHYFVGDHGYYREVPLVVYYYSLIHTYSVFVTLFLRYLQPGCIA
jgi:hypothetical protein